MALSDPSVSLAPRSRTDTALFDCYVVDALKRWGRNIGGPAGVQHLGYPTQSTVYTAMRFAGRSPRSNVRPPTPDFDQDVWLVELIVAQIATYDLRMAVVLRAAFCWWGTWSERMSRATAFLERSGAERRRLSRRTYFRVRDEGIREVRDYLLLDEAA